MRVVERGRWRRELGPILALAGPVVLAEVGWMGMGIVDTMIVGRLGAEAIGAVAIGGVLFFAVTVFGMGMLLGLDTLVSQAFGAGRGEDCRRALWQGVYLALALTPPLTAVVFASRPILHAFGVQPAVVRLAVPYIEATAWSLGPLLIYAAFRRYLQAVNRTRPIVFALLSANLINALANWILIFGYGGLPALGVPGSGWATTLARIYMAGVLVVAVLREDVQQLSKRSWAIPRPDPAILRRLVVLGLPAAGHLSLEVGVFATATALAGRFDPASLAAHQIALQMASLTFMIPLGLSSAAAVQVGQALGRRHPDRAARAGDSAIMLGAIFMTAAGVVFLLIPRTILGAFTPDSAVVDRGVMLLRIAAGFQLFDGLQGVITGALRGLGDTHTAMYTNFVAHWLMGLPLGYVLAFYAGVGIIGLWIGLSLGLVVAGIRLIFAWRARSSSIRLDPDPTAFETAHL